MPNLPETFLALFAGHDRAAAIMGDLDEMAQTRGRLWFFAAYVRTLVSLTWRIVLAFVIANAGLQIVVNFLYASTKHMAAVQLRPVHMGYLSFSIMWTLWFVLPFAAVRYGLRDRFVQITFAGAVGAIVTIFFIPATSLAYPIATLPLATAALCYTTWRKPLAVFLCTAAVGCVAFAAVNVINTAIVRRPLTLSTRHFFAHYGAMLIVRSGLLALAVVCSSLHARLLRSPQSGAAHAELA